MQTFNLDLSAKRVIPLLYAKQRNVGTKILIKLTDNEEKYTVPDGVTWSVWYSGSGSEGNYDEIDGRPAVEVEGSTATVELIYLMLDNPGGGEMCLVMNNANGTQLGLWNIPYWVEAIPGADSEAATAYYNAFLDAQKRAEEAADRAEAAADRAESAGGGESGCGGITVSVDEGNTATHNAAEIYDAIENKQTVVYRHDDRLGSEFISLKTATPDVAVFSKTGYPTEFDIFNIEIDDQGAVSYKTSFSSELVAQAVEKVETDTAPVSYLPQDPTPEQQAHARKNVAALAEEAVCVSYEQPTDPEARVWVNPNGEVGNTEKKTETNSATTVAGIVGLALNEMLNNTAARYATIQDAHDGASATADGKVLAYTCGGVLNIMLLDNMESATVINITKDCTLHLNGKKLSFTTAGAYLNINTASNVTINGEVAGSEITKNIANGANEKLVSATDTALRMVGGTYSVYGTYATAAMCVRTENASTSITMYGCTVIADVSVGNSVRCAQFYGNSTIDYCTFEATNKAGAASGATMGIATVRGCDKFTLRKSTIVAKSDGTANAQAVGALANTNVVEDCDIYALSMGLRTNVYGYFCTNDITVINCHIEADGWSDTENEDGVPTPYPVYPISCDADSHITINGGYYWGARDAFATHGSARINGGIFEGCQHGGAYMSGSDIKAKNAIFRNVEYKGTVGWLEGQNHSGAIYCGSPTNNDVNVYFDNCRFESSTLASNGIVAKNTGTEVFLSNCVINGDFVSDMRIDGGNTIHIGKNVTYDANKVHVDSTGILDTTTYADQEFGFETETTTSHALLSVKDERGNWVGIA